MHNQIIAKRDSIKKALHFIIHLAWKCFYLWTSLIWGFKIVWRHCLTSRGNLLLRFVSVPCTCCYFKPVWSLYLHKDMYQIINCLIDIEYKFPQKEFFKCTISDDVITDGLIWIYFCQLVNYLHCKSDFVHVLPCRYCCIMYLIS